MFGYAVPDVETAKQFFVENGVMCYACYADVGVYNDNAAMLLILILCLFIKKLM